MTVARIIVEHGQGQVYAPFQFKDIVKALPGRTWDSTKRCWRIPLYFVDEAANALRAVGCEVHVTRADGTPWTSGRPGAGHRSTPAEGWASALLKAVGPQHQDRVYRALSRVLHPDAGGDTQLMQDLNRARDNAQASSGRWSA